MIWISLGLAAFVTVQLVPFAKIMQLAPLVYVTGLGALGMVFVVGTTVNGSRRWFSLGSIRVQPSEFMKLALVLMLARVIASSNGLEKLRSWLLPAALLSRAPWCEIDTRVIVPHR